MLNVEWDILLASDTNYNIEGVKLLWKWIIVPARTQNGWHLFWA